MLCSFEAKQINLDRFTCKSTHSIVITVFASHCRKTTNWTRLRLKKKTKCISSRPFEVKMEVKLSMVQYKITHKIHYTNNILYNMKKQTNKSILSLLDQYNEQTTKYLFCSCVITRCQIVLAQIYQLVQLTVFRKKIPHFPKRKLHMVY